MKLIAIRHTSVNVPAGTCYGQTDIETSETYEIEREVILNQLKDESFQVIYTSPLSRCRKLAEYIANGNPVINDSRLLELNFGYWEGKLWDEISQTPEAKAWFSDWINLPCLNGESYRQLYQRVKDFTQYLKYDHPNETILIVTHSGVIRALTCLATEMELQKSFELKIDFGSINQLYL